MSLFLKFRGRNLTHEPEASATGSAVNSDFSKSAAHVSGSPQHNTRLTIWCRAFLLLIGASVVSSVAQAAPIPGETLPPMRLTTPSGQTRAVWQEGKVTVISFCAFWCDTWKEQSRRLDASRAALRGLPVEWTMISVDGRWSGAANNSKWSDIARDALHDTGSRWTHRLNIPSVPYTLVVDGRGKIHFAAQGIARGTELRAGVQKALSTSAASNVAQPLHLVFDDFPSRNSKLDDALLDVLRVRGLRATFCGSKTRQNTSLAVVARARREGHIVRERFESKNRTIVDPFDYKLAGETELLRRVTGAVAPGKILLLRAGVRETVQVLPRLLDSLRSRGLNVAP